MRRICSSNTPTHHLTSASLHISLQNQQNQVSIYSDNGIEFFSRRRRRLARNDFLTGQEWIEYRNRALGEDIAEAQRNLASGNIQGRGSEADVDEIRFLQDNNNTDSDMNMTGPAPLQEVPEDLALFIDVVDCTFKVSLRECN